MRRIAVTVDVEAHGFRAAKDHINRLIWGRQQGREQGIGAMMDIADNHHAPLTFFVDYPEGEIYGEELLDVAREIRRRGHDPQPHCHAEYLGRKLFGMDAPDAVRIGNVSRPQADRMVEYLVDCHTRVTGSAPLAHRSRGYELSAPYLDALKHAGFALDASYSLSCKRDPLRLGLRGPFRFSNGLLEIPVPFVPYFQNAGPLIPWNFNHRHFLTPDIEENLRRHEIFLDTWFKRHGNGAVATLIMHSWSFWKMEPGGLFTIPDDASVELFERLLGFLKTKYEIVALGRLAENEEARCDQERVDARLAVDHCPICREPVSHFQDYYTPKRKCPFCKSLERHRTLVDLVYSGTFGPQVFHEKNILHIAPVWPESLLLRRIPTCRITTLNILPGCDMQADIQHMPELADNTFDIVLASEVFRHVKDLDAALKEIARVLRPGGLLLCSDCLENADYGREITDEAEQISWYGKEKLDAYGIGDFRRFGRKDWEEAFKQYFHTRIFKADDRATGLPAWWLACTPRTDGAASCPQPAGLMIDAAILRSNAGRIFMDAEHDPLPKFLPDFHDWPQFRQLFAPRDLTWLKKNLFTLCFENFRPVPCNKKFANFPSTYPSNFHPYEDQSFTYLLPELSQDASHGDSPHLRHMIAETERWIIAYGFSTQALHMNRHTNWMVWHDSATAIRLNFMAYILLRMLPLTSYPASLIEKIFRSMLDHFLLLCADSFFSAHNNHGWLQMFGLLSFCRAMPQVSNTKAAADIAAKRVLELAHKLITPDGMLREHSPGYQGFCITLFADMRELFKSTASPDLEEMDTLLEKMRFCLSCEVKPDGELAPFGDTSPLKAFPLIKPEVERAAQMANIDSGLNILRESGYAMLRLKTSTYTDKLSFLAMNGSFHSMTHKHCDELSFIWCEGRQNILIDSGQQKNSSSVLYHGPLWEKGFYYASPNCVYAESAHAHNVVEINGQTWSRRTTPYGTLPLHGQQLLGNQWILEGEWQRPEGFLQKRSLILSPGRWLLVLDRLEAQRATSPKPTKFIQWFHFDPSLDLEELQGQMAIYRLPSGERLHCQSFLSRSSFTCHKGEFSPRLQGWMADINLQLIPACALALTQTHTSASFCTLFSLVGPGKIKDLSENTCLLHFPQENTEHITLPGTGNADFFSKSNA